MWLGLFLVAATPPITVADDQNAARLVHTITWTDSTAHPRSVQVLDDNLRIVRYAYTIDGTPVINDELAGYGIGNLVDHGGCGHHSSLDSLSQYQGGPAFAGPNHFIWRSTFLLAMCGETGNWRITNEYVFTNGDDHFIQTVSYDSSDVADGAFGDDMRGPYNQTSWPGNGNITGFGWGEQYKFKTTGAIGDGIADNAYSVPVTWEWTAHNTIPYVWEWADLTAGAAVDREYGIVQNQSYAEQDFGGGFFGNATSGAFASIPPLSGTALPADWALPSQVDSYDSNYRSGRITWGAPYGVFNNHRANDTGTVTDTGALHWPVDAWSWTHVVGKFSAHGVTAKIADTENIYTTSMSASVGTVVTSGPRGPGTFVGASVGTMPTMTYGNPGYDFIYRAWKITAAGAHATFALDTTNGLAAPTIIVHEWSTTTAAVILNGALLVDGRDVLVSVDTATARLFVTLTHPLPAGVTTFDIVVPPPTPTGGSSDGSTSGSVVTTTSGGGSSTGTSSGGGSAAPTPIDTPVRVPIKKGCGCEGANGEPFFFFAAFVWWRARQRAARS